MQSLRIISPPRLSEVGGLKVLGGNLAGRLGRVDKENRMMRVGPTDDE